MSIYILLFAHLLAGILAGTLLAIGRHKRNERLKEDRCHKLFINDRDEEVMELHLRRVEEREVPVVRPYKYDVPYQWGFVKK